MKTWSDVTKEDSILKDNRIVHMVPYNKGIIVATTHNLYYIKHIGMGDNQEIEEMKFL